MFFSQSSLLSSLIKSCIALSEPALESMVNLDDWHEVDVCVIVNWDPMIRHYVAKNQEAAII